MADFSTVIVVDLPAGFVSDDTLMMDQGLFPPSFSLEIVIRFHNWFFLFSCLKDNFNVRYSSRGEK
jgi:hypothetical protein